MASTAEYQRQFRLAHPGYAKRNRDRINARSRVQWRRWPAGSRPSSWSFMASSWKSWGSAASCDAVGSPARRCDLGHTTGSDAIVPDPRAAAMTEAQLMEAIRAQCTQLGLYAYHAHDSRRSWGPGYPDLTITGPGGLIFRECKTEHGPVTPGQKRWGYILQASGQDWAVWRPRHLLDGSITRQLATIAGLRQKRESA